jgi:uncharacterized protein with NAD-binding domain and iron-sulfur cluster
MSSKKKIVILGSGVGAMTAAVCLTNKPGWQNEYDITLYQMGWRCGGKGASGRNRQIANRIEEHGLHIWIGFYLNAFHLMKEACASLRALGIDQPFWHMENLFRTEAVNGFQANAVQEWIDGRWLNWVIHFPVDESNPPWNADRLPPTVNEFIGQIFAFLQSFLHEHPGLEAIGKVVLENSLWSGIEHLFHSVFGSHSGPSTSTGLFGEFAAALAGIVAKPFTHEDLASPNPDPAHPLNKLDGLLHLLRPVLRAASNISNDARRLFIVVDLSMAVIRGLVNDQILTKGFDSIDDIEYRDWLAKWGAEPDSVNSALVRALYDLAFGFEDGAVSKPNMAAGVALRSMLRILLDHHGAVFWKMQAGMGDTIFAPLYTLLEKRGVQFKFFHRAEELALDSDGRNIGKIRLNVQATVKGGGAYQPLFDAQGTGTPYPIPSWPSAPFHDQLEQGEALKSAQINLESAWTQWPGVGTLELERGKDFDIVVLGISVGALARLTPTLCAADPAWREMCTQLKTVQTQACQLWVKDTVEQLGWNDPGVVMDAYAENLDTWADMSHLIPRESWSPEQAPGSIAYFCGVLDDASIRPPEPPDPAYPKAQSERVKNMAVQWITSNTAHLWPKAAVPLNPVGFDWNKLVDATGAEGVARFDSQYWRANIDPSERYVLSLTGQTRYRLPADRSGFENLFLAGDWTYTGLNVGCVEAGAMSGMRASQAICGEPVRIIGEETFRYPTSNASYKAP